MKKNRFFILDTNTLISAFILSNTSVAAQAYYKAKSKGEIAISESAFDEFANVFIRPKFDKYISLENRMAAIQDLKEIIKFISITITITACRYPKDTNFLN